MKLLLFLTLLISALSTLENIAVMELDPDGVTPAEARTLTN